jgi:uncharacterized protein YcbK (DUF882 family)
MKLSKNFNLIEFACKDGTQVPDRLIANVQKLATNLQVLRDHIGEAVFLNSGYRSPKYNARIGGAKNSMHMQAKAADITTKSYSPKQLKSIIEKLIKEGKMENGGIGLYPSFVHYDVGPARRW